MPPSEQSDRRQPPGYHTGGREVSSWRWLLFGAITLLVGSALSTGCAGSQRAGEDRRPGQTTLKVETLAIRGVESFSKRKLKNGLATREDPGWRAKISWMPLIGSTTSYFNVLDWRKDLERIRTFYRSRGYYNVQIVRENIDKNIEEGTVRLYVQILEGEPIKVDTLSVEGLTTVDRYNEESILAELPLQKGKVFTEEDYLETKEGIRKRLEQQGYAYAELSGRAFVYPSKQQAKVRFIADPGPQAVFGEINVEGLNKIPERFVREAIGFEPGDPYSTDVLQQTQETVYKMEVFSLVSVLPAFQLDDLQTGQEDQQAAEEPQETTTQPPDTPAPGPLGISELLNSAQTEAEQRTKLSPRVPITVRLKEARMWNVRVGAGFSAESNRQDVHGLVDVTSKNFLGGLRKMEWSNTVGHAWAPGFLQPDDEQASNRGVILSSELTLTQPWLDQDTNIRFSPSVDRDIQVGYTLWNPSARLGIDRTFFDHLTAGIGYRISYFNFNNINQDLADETPLGQDFQPEFILEFLEQSIGLDYRNNPLNPTKGWAAQLTFQEAANYLFNGEFTYLKTSFSTEGYIPFQAGTKWVLAARLKAGAIYNIESVEETDGDVDTQRVPTISRFYSGGKGSMRTFARRNLSIYKGTVPVGGLTQAEINIEPRFRIVPNLADIGDVWGAVFFDAGTVLKGQFVVETPANESLDLGTESPGDVLSSLLYGVGVGFWWVTPIGPVRADFGYTISDISDDPRFRQCSADDQPETGDPTCEKVPLAEDDIQDKLLRYNFIIGIGHSF